MMGHLNSFSASGGGNLNKNFPKIQMPRGLPGAGGKLKLRFDWYISRTFFHKIEAQNQGCGLSTDTSVFGVLKHPN